MTMEAGNSVFRKVVIRHKSWDNKFTFFVRAISIDEAENKAWAAFKEHNLGGVLPIDEWKVKEASLYPFKETNVYFI